MLIIADRVLSAAVSLYQDGTCDASAKRRPGFIQATQGRKEMSHNLFANPGDNHDEEWTSVLANGEHVRIERIVSRGQVSPPGYWYDQDQSEWVVLLEGAAQIEFEDRSIEDLNPGDYLLIPAHQKHRVAFTDQEKPTVWLAVFFD